LITVNQRQLFLLTSQFCEVWRKLPYPRHHSTQFRSNYWPYCWYYRLAIGYTWVRYVTSQNVAVAATLLTRCQEHYSGR